MVAFVDETTADLKTAYRSRLWTCPIRRASVEGSAVRWLHYRARLIPRHQPRQVVFSDNAKANLPSHPAIGEIAAILRVGGDVSPWLSDRVRRRKKDAKADLCSTTGKSAIFHLGLLFERPKKTKRSDLLLFAFINPIRAVLLDVQPHKSWGMQALLRALFATSLLRYGQ